MSLRFLDGEECDRVALQKQESIKGWVLGVSPVESAVSGLFGWMSPIHSSGLKAQSTC